MTLGEFLKQAREERGYTLRMLAAQCHTSPSEISRIENGFRKQPSPVILRSIAEALVVSYPFLMQLAGYLNDDIEPEEKISDVLTTRDGTVIDAADGIKEMLKKDASWANTSYRVSTELPECDRQLLTEMAMAFLERKLNNGKE